MLRRISPLCLLVLSFLLFNCSGGSEILDSESTAQPNIIIFLADDLGYGDLGSYGNPIIKTPNIDKLASEGVRMTDFHSGGTVCSPSRASLLTGRNPYRSGFFYISGRDTHLKDDEITIAEILKERDYETSFWGKWHLSSLEKDRRDEPGPADQGFDYWLGTTVNAFGGPENPDKFILNGEATGTINGWYCDIVVDSASSWLENKRDSEKPFFMYVSTHEPHTPIDPPENYSNLYQTEEVDSLEQTVRYGAVARPEKDISENKDEYYGTVTQLDKAFGRLMASLDRLGLRENTIVIFTSDNGPETPVTIEESLGTWDDPIRDYCFGTPGILRGMKRFPYEGGHRVPGIIRYPGVVPAGSTSNVLFNGSDFLPTLAALTGATTPSDRPIDGVDAFGAFLDKEVQRDVSPIWFYPNHEDTYFRMPQIALRSDQHSLIGSLPPKPDSLGLNEWIAQYDPVDFELYDLSNDPSQRTNILLEKPELASNMKEEMIRLWREMRDEGLEEKSN